MSGPPCPEQTVPLAQRFRQQGACQLPQLAAVGEDEEGGGVARMLHLQHGALQRRVVEEVVAGLLLHHADLHGPVLVHKELLRAGGMRVKGSRPPG